MKLRAHAKLIYYENMARTTSCSLTGLSFFRRNTISWFFFQYLYKWFKHTGGLYIRVHITRDLVIELDICLYSFNHNRSTWFATHCRNEKDRSEYVATCLQWSTHKSCVTISGPDSFRTIINVILNDMKWLISEHIWWWRSTIIFIPRIITSYVVDITYS